MIIFDEYDSAAIKEAREQLDEFDRSILEVMDYDGLTTGEITSALPHVYGQTGHERAWSVRLRLIKLADNKLIKRFEEEKPVRWAKPSVLQ